MKPRNPSSRVCANVLPEANGSTAKDNRLQHVQSPVACLRFVCKALCSYQLWHVFQSPLQVKAEHHAGYSSCWNWLHLLHPICFVMESFVGMTTPWLSHSRMYISVGQHLMFERHETLTYLPNQFYLVANNCLQFVHILLLYLCCLVGSPSPVFEPAPAG